MNNERIEKNIITEVKGKGVPLGGHDIDTDRIIPGRFLLCTTFSGLGEYAFADDKAADSHPFDDPRFKDGTILLSGRNFGCGSSREHAAQALMRWGIRAVVAESFAEIFLDNARACGVVCVQLPWGTIEKLVETVRNNPKEEIAVDIEAGELRMNGERHPIQMHDAVRRCFLNGTWDVLDVLLSAEKEIEAVRSALPYLEFQVEQ